MGNRAVLTKKRVMGRHSSDSGRELPETSYRNKNSPAWRGPGSETGIHCQKL